MEDKENLEARRSSPPDPQSGDAELDALLADARKLTGEELPEGGPEAPAAPSEEKPKGPGQEESILELAEQIKVLTEEVRLLRAQSAGALQNGAMPAGEIPPDVKGEPEKPLKNKVLSVIGNILFYVAVVGMVFGAFLLKNSAGGRPTVIAGYSAFTVLTSSMEDVYPKGSVVITKSVDADALEVGDDITFMVSETSSVTHRIISIIEKHPDTGERAFETKGVMNKNPDKDLVAAANVVGQVIFCSKLLGDMITFTKANWPLMVFALVVIGALIWFLQWNSRRFDEDMSATGKKMPDDIKSEKQHKKK